MHSFLTKKVQFVIALSLYFATLEALLPHPLFLRYGFAYIPLLILSSRLNLKEFLLALIFKSIISSVFSLTLFSLMFFMSFISTLASGVIIWILCSNKYISHLGVSILSSFVSNIVQIYLSSFLLYGRFSFILAPVVFITGFISSIVVGLIANGEDKRITTLFENADKIRSESEGEFRYKARKKTTLMLMTSAFMMVAMVFISSLFSPQGDVLFSYGIITVGSVSLRNAIIKSALLLITVMLSFILSLLSIKVMKNKHLDIWLYYSHFTTNDVIFNRKKMDSSHID